MFNPTDSKKRFLEDMMQKASGGMAEDLKGKYGPKPAPAADAVPGPAELVPEPEGSGEMANHDWTPPKDGSLDGLPPDILELLRAALSSNGGGKGGAGGPG